MLRGVIKCLRGERSDPLDGEDKDLDWKGGYVCANCSSNVWMRRMRVMVGLGSVPQLTL